MIRNLLLLKHKMCTLYYVYNHTEPSKGLEQSTAPFLLDREQSPPPP